MSYQEGIEQACLKCGGRGRIYTEPNDPGFPCDQCGVYAIGLDHAIDVNAWTRAHPELVERIVAAFLETAGTPIRWCVPHDSPMIHGWDDITDDDLAKWSWDMGLACEGWRGRREEHCEFVSMLLVEPKHGEEVTHRCPPEGESLMPCCGRTPFEVSRTDRIASDPSLVTCGIEEEGNQ